MRPFIAANRRLLIAAAGILLVLGTVVGVVVALNPTVPPPNAAAALVLSTTSTTARAPAVELSPDTIQRAQHARAKLEQLGLSPQQAAGIVGNLVVDSSVDPTALPPRAQAYGVAQWLNNAGWDRLQAFAAQDSLRRPITELDLQLEFLRWDLDHPHYPGSLDRFWASTTVTEAARTFALDYLHVLPNSLIHRIRCSETVATL